MSVKNQSDSGKSSETEGRGGLGGAYDSARDRALDAYDSARDAASSAGQKLGDQIGTTPLVVLVGGLAAGALAGALMKRTRVEQKLLGPAAGRLTGAGRDAIDAARRAGKDKLGELNLTRDAGASLVKSVIDGIGQVAKTSGEAALGAVRGKGGDD